jgi:hypothetical protein
MEGEACVGGGICHAIFVTEFLGAQGELVERVGVVWCGLVYAAKHNSLDLPPPDMHSARRLRPRPA